MKKAVNLFLIIIAPFLVLSCQQKAAIPHDDRFVSLEDGVFVTGRDTFNLLMLNYVVGFRNFNGEFVVSPSIQYEVEDRYEVDTKFETEAQLERHFRLISSLGFNTIRVCCDRMTDDDKGHYFYQCDHGHFSIINDSALIFNGFETLLNAAAKNNLRVMLLMKPPFKGEPRQFAEAVLKHFSDNPTLMAYDFMNEPLYFDETEMRKKKDACRTVKGWKDMMRKYAPNQLFTIGFSEPIEVFEWDPSVLDVDFVEMHTYHPLRVANEMYWYGRYVGKPWIVGETSLPADNDSITYKEQERFMIDAYRRALDCGAIGFGWWEFQDINTGNYEARYSGLLNHEGVTVRGSDTIVGSLKDAAFQVRNLAGYSPKHAEQKANYFNILGYNNLVIKGKILDKRTKQPIEGAVVRGWNYYWGVGLNTFTDSEGRFMLYSNDECVHFEVSAPGKTKLKFNRQITNYQMIDSGYSFDRLPDRQLEYHNIAYHPFLHEPTTDTTSTLFDFDERHFSDAKFAGDMGTLYLKDL